MTKQLNAAATAIVLGPEHKAAEALAAFLAGRIVCARLRARARVPSCRNVPTVDPTARRNAQRKRRATARHAADGARGQLRPCERLESDYAPTRCGRARGRCEIVQRGEWDTERECQGDDKWIATVCDRHTAEALAAFLEANQ